MMRMTYETWKRIIDCERGRWKRRKRKAREGGGAMPRGRRRNKRRRKGRRGRGVLGVWSSWGTSPPFPRGKELSSFQEHAVVGIVHVLVLAIQ